jgi:hypothetical protein
MSLESYRPAAGRVQELASIYEAHRYDPPSFGLGARWSWDWCLDRPPHVTHKLRMPEWGVIL